ncbi:GerAB/ArcD/ProY family transporter [Guptibacillus hwajinpoensis]|uniref:GerAB/ArcD/ProY family transporter n=1 Tax=Guptibacillus hwajinpoensis TaxID=208199 RepID=UPI003D066032
MSEKIAPFHLAILIYMIQSGVTLYKLPRMLAVNFGTNGWVMILIISFIAGFNIFLVGLVNRFRRGEDVFEIMEGLVPRKVLAPFYVILAIIWSILPLLVGKDYMLITQVLAFQNTSLLLLYSIILLLAIYLVIKDIYTITKATTIFFFLTIWMTFMLIYHIPYSSLIRLTPFILKDGSNPIQGMIEVYTAFLGFEMVLFLFPYIDQTKPKWFRSVYVGHVITTVVYGLTCFVSFMYFSFEQLKLTSFPVLNLIAYIEIELIERIESLVFNLFLMKILITVVMYLWAAKLLLHRAIPAIHEKWCVLILILVAFMITFKVDVAYELAPWLLIFGLAAVGIALGLPLLLLVTLWIRSIRRKRHAN